MEIPNLFKENGILPAEESEVEWETDSETLSETSADEEKEDNEPSTPTSAGRSMEEDIPQGKHNVKRRRV